MSKALPAQSNGAPRNFPEFRYDLGAQLSSGSNYPAALEPEIRLMLMILEDAIAYLRAGLRQWRNAAAMNFPGAEDLRSHHRGTRKLVIKAHDRAQ